MSPVSDVKDVYGSTPALGREAALKPENLIYLKDRSGLAGAAAQPNAGQARSPQGAHMPQQSHMPQEAHMPQQSHMP